jgi:hypothetical protein
VKNFHIALIPADRSGTEFTAADRNTPDYTLNNALERADINQSFEVYLDILERFYADDIEVFVDEPQRRIIGKEAVRAFLFSFLVPIHVIAEVGGLLVSAQHKSIASETRHTTATAWEVTLVAPNGKRRVITWLCLRAWRDSRVVCERLSDAHVEGGPLDGDDLNFARGQLSLAPRTPE